MKAGRADQVAGLVMPLLLDQPALFDALQLLGLSRFRQGRTADGEWLLSAAAGLAPEQGWVWTNLVAGLADCGARQRAFEVALRARRHHPEMPALLRQIATLGITLGNYPAVEEVCAGRAGQDPYLAYCLSNVRLRRGDWRSGFALYEARWEAHGKQRFSPEWNGRADQGEGLVIYDEQGLGDAIQFVRYLPALRRLYRGRLILRVLDPLVELFAGQADEVVSRKATAFANCASFPLMSLPHLLISRG